MNVLRLHMIFHFLLSAGLYFQRWVLHSKKKQKKMLNAMNIISSLLSLVVLKTKRQAPNGVAYTKLHVPKLRLKINYNFGFFQKWNWWPVSQKAPKRQELGPLSDRCRSLKESNLAITSHYFAQCHFFVPAPFCLLPFCPASQGLFLPAGWEAAWFMNHRIKPIRSLPLTQLKLVFWQWGEDDLNSVSWPPILNMKPFRPQEMVCRSLC